jgi:ribonuclease VapC
MMIAVDTSAVIAILLAEPEAEPFAKLVEAGDAAISAGSLTETLRVMMVKRGAQAVPHVWAFIRSFSLRVVEVTEAQVHLAEEGMLRFGIGRAAPPAVLNFGDLFAYALARHLDAPLLYKGDDFSRTDLRPAFSP